ncbi:sensor histidine kinase [Hydrogenophaga sp.]|uniref:sensor histidine kinase n=1 Tax=Hydrogenophaga sp. TaxID=1904254 RepID=UPI0025C3E6C3|nr:histidine kinase [Hydrogenophaga sp.]
MPLSVALRRHAVPVLIVNTLIAGAITLGTHERFLVNLVYAHCIGGLIWIGIDLGRYLFAGERGWPGAKRLSVLVVLSVLGGYLLGNMLANALLQRPLLLGLANLPRSTLVLLLMSLVAGGVGAYFFTTRELLAQARLASEEAQRQASEARLRLLESQLEPHMLFNTLANLRALIAADPPRAIAMLDRLNGFLRATLAASRTDAHQRRHTLRDEFARLDDYLQLMAVRMGPRLRVHLSLPDALADQAVPPLLLQPLVENAIRHGLEPSAAGGEVRIEAAADTDAGTHADTNGLRLTISDNGVGTDRNADGGFGLTQVRERLHTVYGDAARLDWRSAPGQGTAATLHLPLSNTVPAPNASSAPGATHPA